MSYAGDDEADKRDKRTSAIIFAIAVLVFFGIPGALLAWSSIQSSGDKAEAQLQFLKQHGATKEEICVQARRVQDLYAQERNGPKYDSAKSDASIACIDAELEAMRGPDVDMNATDLNATDINAASNASVAAADAALNASEQRLEAATAGNAPSTPPDSDDDGDNTVDPNATDY